MTGWPPWLVNINWSWMWHLLIRRQIKADKSYFAWPLLGRFEDSSGYFHGADALKELLLSLPSLKYMHITPSLQLFILSLSTQLISVKYIWVLERHSPGRGSCVRKPSWSKVEWCHSIRSRQRWRSQLLPAHLRRLLPPPSVGRPDAVRVYYCPPQVKKLTTAHICWSQAVCIMWWKTGEETCQVI